jgi:large subunit ribosomal protein L2
LVPAALGTKIGSTITFGLNADIVNGNVISIQNIPDGTIVCNVEKHFGDGGSIAKTAGNSATVFSHSVDGVVLKLPSGGFTTLNPKNRAMVGVLAGGGVSDRPFLNAGNKWRRYRSKGHKYPIVRGVAQAAYVHPHGGGRHQHMGGSGTVSRNAPPGAKVGSIAARKTGRARVKERV